MKSPNSTRSLTQSKIPPKNNKRHLRADSLSLRLSALRPRLLSGRRVGKKVDGVFSPLMGKIGKKANIAFLPLSGLIFAGIFSLFLQTSYASAASLTLTVPGAIKLEINPGASATFSKSSASSIGVKTDAAFGYDLSIKVKDGANGNSLVNGSNKLNSISANLSEESYKAAGNDNTWGYLPSKVNSSDNTEFLPGPTTSLTTLDKTSAKNDTDNNYSITLAAKVDQTIPTGNYTNTFVFTAAANTVSYSITYDLNSGSGGPSPNPQTGTTSSGTIKLDSTAPSREGYEFKGWCTVSTSDESCSGTTYQPGANYPLQNNSNTLTLWAMWKATVLYMQNWNGCNELRTNQTITLTDSRDGNTYTVAKLLDGKCWMMDDLRIAGKNLTQYDSNLSGPFVLPQSGEGGGFWDHQEKPVVYLIDIGDKVSGMYTWQAAVGIESLENSTQFIESQYSICPAGWHLPSREQSNMVRYLKLTEGTTGYYGNYVCSPQFPSKPETQCYWSNYGGDKGGNECGARHHRATPFNNAGSTPSVGCGCYIRCNTN